MGDRLASGQLNMKLRVCEPEIFLPGRDLRMHLPYHPFVNWPSLPPRSNVLEVVLSCTISDLENYPLMRCFTRNFLIWAFWSVSVLVHSDAAHAQQCRLRLNAPNLPVEPAPSSTSSITVSSTQATTSTPSPSTSALPAFHYGSNPIRAVNL